MHVTSTPPLPFYPFLVTALWKEITVLNSTTTGQVWNLLSVESDGEDFCGWLLSLHFLWDVLTFCMEQFSLFHSCTVFYYMETGFLWTAIRKYVCVGIFKCQKCIASSSVRKSHIKAPAGLLSGEDPLLTEPHGCSIRQKKWATPSTSSPRALTLARSWQEWPNHLPKASPLSMNTKASKVSSCRFEGDTNIQTISNMIGFSHPFPGDWNGFSGWVLVMKPWWTFTCLSCDMCVTYFC